jgi:hypothetical protein
MAVVVVYEASIHGSEQRICPSVELFPYFSQLIRSSSLVIHHYNIYHQYISDFMHLYVGQKFQQSITGTTKI